MPDITPRLAAGRQLINAYGNGGFRVAGVAHAGSILVFPGRTLAWPVARFEDLAPQSLEPVLAEVPRVELLVIGLGPALRRLPDPLRNWSRAAGIAVDGMDTGAACRTFNVLLSEERRAAAALIAVD
ncbi:MAG: Mth938-like domain-containing protein [Alphaproteobacteria bacterium]|nr:Mth938-like domain-containing protein [Alphaproteobacteria bacterium]